MQLARKTLFYIFVLAYIVLCPLILLHSFGYVYSSEEKEIARTGLVHLDTVPRGAHVYLGKSHYKYRTPTDITELYPGEYQISVRLSGYRPWTRWITILPGKATVFDDIILLPEEFSSSSLSQEMRFKHMQDLKGTHYSLLRQGRRLGEFSIYDRQREELRSLLSPEEEYSDFATVSVFTDKRSALLVVWGGSLWDRKYFSIDLTSEDRPLTEITKLLSQHPEHFERTDEEARDIFAVHEDHVDLLDIRTRSVKPGFFDKIKGFGSSDKWLYVLDQDNVILKYTLDKEDRIKLFEDQSLGRALFARSRFYDIKELRRDILLFHGDRGDLITTVPPYSIAESDILGFNYNEERNMLVFWSKGMIRVADYDMAQEGDLLFRDRVRLDTVYENGSDILQCFWVHDATHLLYKDGDEVYLLDLAPDGKHHKEFIVRVKRASEISYSEATGSLYYLDRKERLKKITIIHGRDQ